jgi:hypothetical protein
MIHRGHKRGILIVVVVTVAAVIIRVTVVVAIFHIAFLLIIFSWRRLLSKLLNFDSKIYSILTDFFGLV